MTFVRLEKTYWYRNLKVYCANSEIVFGDYDFMWSESADPANPDPVFDAARYMLTPALRGTMYMSKMSVLPECVKNLNICNINGWFRVDALNKK